MNKNNNKYRLGILVSGNGTNLQAIIDAIQNATMPYTQVSIVISNKQNAYALQRARNAGIDAIYLNPKEFNSPEEYDKKIGDVLISHKVELVVLAGYLRIITNPLLELFPQKILNIHPGLLPDFGGANMYKMKVHEAVISAGVKYSGCTVHVVTEELDKGPIIDQAKVEVLSTDTPQSLAERIAIYEHQLYPKVIYKYLCSLNKE